MRMHGKPALPGLALAIAVPLIPGLSCLAAGQPTAPACVPARRHAVPSRLRPAPGGISPAECVPAAWAQLAVRPAATAGRATR